MNEWTSPETIFKSRHFYTDHLNLVGAVNKQ